jgi:WD40 repeat protein
MKFELLEHYNSFATGSCSACTWISSGHPKGDVIYYGTIDGEVYYILPDGRTPKPEHVAIGQLKEGENNISVVSNSMGVTSAKRHPFYHLSEVLCLLVVKYPSIAPLGLLFSGSRDRSIKVWNINTVGKKTLIQTLLGHTGGITSLVDAQDGSFISASTDGSIRIWSAQKNREMMLNPFFECIFHVTINKDVWLTSLAINPFGAATLYIGGSNGSVELYRKNIAQSDSKLASAHTFYKFKKFDSIHKLGITKLELLISESYLVSLSSDGSCRVSDALLGHPLYQIKNCRKCIYTGVIFETASLVLSDEFGYIEVFDLVKERIKFTRHVVHAKTSKCESEILLSHKSPLIRHITAYNEDRKYLMVSTPSSSNTTDPVYESNGMFAIWKAVYDVTCTEFLGHTDTIIGFCIPTFKENDHITTATSKLLSRDECKFFSVSLDNTIRCWDEFENAESYQIKNKLQNTEIMCMTPIWSINSFLTGHESGLVLLWHADSGSHISSKALKASVTALVEAQRGNRHVVIGCDYSGHIAVWNLSLLASYPGDIPTDQVFIGYHDQEEPSILSLVYHKATNTIFSGGVDSSICIFRLDSEINECVKFHKDSVTSLECTDTLLLSGDEVGLMVLWRILDCTSTTALPRIVPLCELRCNPELSPISTRAVFSLVEVELGKRAYIAQGGNGKTFIWFVWLQPRVLKQRQILDVGSGVTVTGRASILTLNSLNRQLSGTIVLTSNKFIKSDDSNADSFKKMFTSHLSDAVAEPKSGAAGSSAEDKGNDDSFVKIFELKHDDLYISSTKFQVLHHDDMEANKITIIGKQKEIDKVYVGFVDTGVVYKYKI